MWGALPGNPAGRLDNGRDTYEQDPRDDQLESHQEQAHAGGGLLSGQQGVKDEAHGGGADQVFGEGEAATGGQAGGAGNGEPFQEVDDVVADGPGVERLTSAVRRSMTSSAGACRLNVARQPGCRAVPVSAMIQVSTCRLSGW